MYQALTGLQLLLIPTTTELEEALNKALAKALAKTPKFDPTKMILNGMINEASWFDWCKDRSKRKKPLTERAATEQLRFLESFSKDQQEQIISTSIMNGYTGLFPPKVNHGSVNQNGFTAGGSRDQNRKLSTADRVQQNIARERAARAQTATGGDRGNLAPDVTPIRPSVDERLRGVGGRRERMGGVFEGDYERTD